VKEDTAKQAEQFNDTMALLGKSGQGVARMVAADMLPMLTSLATRLLGSATEGDRLSTIAKVLSGSLKGLFTVGVIGVEIFNSLGKSIGAAVGAVVAASQGNLREAMGVLKAGGDDIKAGWTGALSMIQSAWNGTADASILALAKMTRDVPTATEQTGKLASATEKLLDSYVKLAAAGAQRLAEQQAELESGRKLTDAEKDYLRVMADVRDGKVKLVDVQRLGVQARLQENIATAAAIEQAKAEKQEQAKLLAAQIQRRQTEVKGAQDAVSAAQWELQTYGLLRSQVAELTLLRLRDRQAMAASDSEEKAALQLQIEAYETLVQLYRRGEARDAAAKAARESAELWQRASQTIEQSLTDALMRGFESGRGFVDSFISSAKSAFKSLVLQPTIRAIVQPLAAGVTGALGLPGLAQAGQAGSMLSGIGGIGNLLSGGLSGIGNSVAFGADALGSFLVNNTGGMLNSLGGGLMSNAGMLGTIAPYAAAAAAAMALFRSLRHRRTPHMGSVVGVGAGGASTLFGDDSGILNNFQSETDAALRGLGGASIGTLNDLSQAFGGAGGFGGTLKFAADGNDASIGQFILGRGGNIVSQVGSGATSLTGGGQFAFYSKDREEAFTAFTVDVARATRQALDSIALPDWARRQMAALGNDATIEQITALAQVIATTQRAIVSLSGSFNQLGGIFGRVSNLTSDAFMQLAEFAGGMDQLQAQARSFVENYYGREEIAGIKAREIQLALAAVGIEQDISTREQFRAVVEGVDVTTEQGRQQLATLLAAQGSFAEIAAYIEEMGGSLASIASGAPEMGALGGLLTAPEQAQINAINGVTTAVESVREAILDLGAAVVSSSPRDTWSGSGGRVGGDWETTVQP